MKKVILSLATIALALSSCTSVSTTATVMSIPTSLQSANEADLQVSDKIISYTYIPTKGVDNTTLSNIRKTAIAEAMKANGGGDVLVHPNFQITTHRGFFRKKVTKVVVTGHIGTYKNFRSAKPCCKK